MADSGPLTQDQALALLTRTSDEGWLTTELSGPDGTAAINARTAIAAATSQALMDQAATMTISDAPGGNPGVCTLTVSRENGAVSHIYLPAGYPFATAEGIVLVLTQAIIISVGATSFDLPLQTLRSTELVNTFVPAFDSLQQPGTLMQTGAAATPIFDSHGNRVLGPSTPDNGYSLRYAASTTIAGATSDWLSAHGNERGQRRNSGETTEEYRARIRLFPDAVSPVAIATAVHAAANNAGLPDVFFVETINPGASPDKVAAYSLGFQDTVFDGDYCDDPVGVDLPAKYPWRSLEMISLREGRAYFRLAMAGQLKEPDGAVLYCDDGFLDDLNWGYPDVGLAVRTKGALMTIANTAKQLRAGGVLFDLVIEDGVVIGPEVGASWNLTPTEGTAWLLRDGLVTHTPGLPGTNFHRLVFTFSDASTFTTPWFDGVASEHLTVSYLAALAYPFKPVTNISGETGGVGVSMTGTFWAVTFTL